MVPVPQVQGPLVHPADPGVPPELASPRPWQLPLGIAATVVGAGGIGAGTGLGFMARSAYDASNQVNCSKATNQCNAAGVGQRSDAVTKGNIGTGVFVAGAVFAAGGIAAWITAPRSSAPQVGVGPAGLALRGAW
jgi:hypothetical protein